MKKVTTVALVLLLGGLTSCSTEETSDGEGSTGSIATYMSEQDASTGLVRLADAYDEDVSHVVVACAFSSASDIQDRLGFAWPGAAELVVEENQQAVVAARNGKVVESEVMSRQVLDLCADLQVEYPVELDPAASLEVTAEEWSDGATYPVAELE